MTHRPVDDAGSPFDDRQRSPHSSPGSTSVDGDAAYLRALAEAVLSAPESFLEHHRRFAHGQRSEPRSASPTSRASDDALTRALLDLFRVGPLDKGPEAGRLLAPVTAAQALGDVLDVELALGESDGGGGGGQCRGGGERDTRRAPRAGRVASSLDLARRRRPILAPGGRRDRDRGDAGDPARATRDATRARKAHHLRLCRDGAHGDVVQADDDRRLDPTAMEQRAHGIID